MRGRVTWNSKGCVDFQLRKEEPAHHIRHLLEIFAHPIKLKLAPLLLLQLYHLLNEYLSCWSVCRTYPTQIFQLEAFCKADIGYATGVKRMYKCIPVCIHFPLGPTLFTATNRATIRKYQGASQPLLTTPIVALPTRIIKSFNTNSEPETSNLPATSWTNPELSFERIKSNPRSETARGHIFTCLSVGAANRIHVVTLSQHFQVL